MKLIKPKFEILEQAPGMDGMLKQIEIAGRTCYKSHDKITEDSAERFVERMKSLGHGSVLEHGTVYLIIENDIDNALFIGKYLDNKHSFVNNGITYSCITTNYRVLMQGNHKTWDDAVKNNFYRNWLSDLQHQCDPTEHHEKRVTVRFTTDIGISREFNRHRVNSVSEQSTRYCNYSKDKFGNEISVVPPTKVRSNAEKELKTGIDFFSNEYNYFSVMCGVVLEITRDGGDFTAFTDIDTWLFANLATQWAYMRLTNVFGWSAQEARSVLPLDTQTEFYHTAFVSDWKHFFELRCDSHAHPMARELAIPLREEFVKRKLIKEK